MIENLCEDIDFVLSPFLGAVGLGERPSKDKRQDLFYNLRQHRNVHDVTVTPSRSPAMRRMFTEIRGIFVLEDVKMQLPQQRRQENYKINHRPSQEKQFLAFTGANQASRTRKILGSREGRACFRCCKGVVWYRKTRYKSRLKQTAKLHMMFAQLQRLAKKPQVHRRVSVSGRHHSGRCSGYRAGGFVLSGTAAHGEEQTRTGKVNAIQQGIITASTKTRLEELEAQKSDLEVSILQAQLQGTRYTKELVGIGSVSSSMAM